MSHDDARYASINEVTGWPPISRNAAEYARRHLIHRFGKSYFAPVGLRSRDLDWHTVPVRRCWISTTHHIGIRKGWARLIHDISHIVFRYRHPSARPHDGGHATLEREVQQWVIDNQWAQRLAEPPKPTTQEKRSKRLTQVEAGILRWQAKQKRANNAISKLRKEQKRLIKVLQRPGL